MQPWVYVVLLGLILIIYARLLPKSETAAASQTNVVQEIEETIEHFAVEMDEQNRALMDLFATTRKDYEVELVKLSGRVEMLEKQKNELSQELTKMQVAGTPSAMLPAELSYDLNKASASAAAPPVQAYEHTAEETKPGVAPSAVMAGLNMKSRYVELFKLYEQGKSVDIIAKKLGMNKGEVNLIIQLSRQEERSRA